MNAFKIPRLMLAMLLVLAVPVEPARCACGSLAPHTARASVAATAIQHSACCGASAASRRAQPAPTHRSCSCAFHASGPLPVTASVSNDGTAVAAFALLPESLPVEPMPKPREHPPARDVGNAPPHAAIGAHGLRAPPSCG